MGPVHGGFVVIELRASGGNVGNDVDYLASRGGFSCT